MGIRIRDGLFSLETKNTLYQMTADEEGLLRHVYYGRKTADDMSYLHRRIDRPFSGNPYDRQNDRSYSTDTLPQEYPTGGAGDYRIPALLAEAGNGSRTCELRFEAARKLRGKIKPAGLPGVRGNEGTEGLEIIHSLPNLAEKNNVIGYDYYDTLPWYWEGLQRTFDLFGISVYNEIIKMKRR